MEYAQGDGFARIKALITAASPALLKEARELTVLAFKPLHSPGDGVPNRGYYIGHLVDHLKVLRDQVAAVPVTGAEATSARDAAVLALLKNEQSLTKLAESYRVSTQTAATVLLAESVSIAKDAKTAGLAAGNALKMPWPFQ